MDHKKLRYHAGQRMVVAQDFAANPTELQIEQLPGARQLLRLGLGCREHPVLTGAIETFQETDMNQILIDSIASLSVHNGVLRIACMSAGPEGHLQSSGTLVIPGAVAVHVLNSLIKGTQELDKKLREQQQLQGSPAGEA